MSNKTKLYIWNNYHNGDIITTIPLIWEIYNQIDNVEVSVGCYKNHSYLYEKTPIHQLLIHPGYDRNDRVDDLGYMCPEGYYNFYTWLGQYPDTQAHTWLNQVKVFNRKCNEYNLNIKLNSNITPSIIFPFVKLDVPVYKNMVWVENGNCRGPHNNFYYDMNKLGSLFPNFYFYTTSDPNSNLPNVINCSHLNLVELSNLSNKCDIILGKGSGPYFTTFTSANRYKFRAIVGFDLNRFPPFWDYENSSIKYISNEDGLIEYLKNII